MISNRKGFPVELKSKVKKGLKTRGESIVLQNHNITISLWQDTRPVVMVSNNTQASDMSTVTRTKRDGTKTNVVCLLNIKLYNQNTIPAIIMLTYVM